MNPTLQRILTSQDPILSGVRENLMANRCCDESAEEAFDRLQRHDMLGRLMVPVGTDPRPADSAANAADFDATMLMPE